MNASKISGNQLPLGFEKLFPWLDTKKMSHTELYSIFEDITDRKVDYNLRIDRALERISILDEESQNRIALYMLAQLEQDQDSTKVANSILENTITELDQMRSSMKSKHTKNINSNHTHNHKKNDKTICRDDVETRSCQFINHIQNRKTAPVDLNLSDNWLKGAIKASSGAGNPAGAILAISNQSRINLDKCIEALISSLADEAVAGQTSFDQIFFETVHQVERRANSRMDTTLFTFGRAQKVVNITLKYCYTWWFCKRSESPKYGDLSWVDQWAPYFHVPVDRYTLDHIKTTQFNHLSTTGNTLISCKWNLSEIRYCRIQDAIRKLALDKGNLNPLCYEMLRVWNKTTGEETE